MMQRTLLLAICLLIAIPAFAANGAVTAPTPTPAMNLQPPLRGLVTISAARGQFYTNLGSRDQLYKGAEVLVLRGGYVLGRAKILKVDDLDSIAQLLPESNKSRIQTGDVVVVQFNPVPQTVSSRLPYWEPDLSHRESETVITLILLGVLANELFSD
ncbi:MAG: hypothetical protein ACYDBB_24510 [Armatimonadota bacterium]